MEEAETSNKSKEIVKSAADEVVESDKHEPNIERHNSNVSVRSFGQAPNQMTLQLVLPSQYGGPRVNDDPHGFDTLSRRSRPPSRTNSILESKSPGFVNTRLVNYNRGISHQPSLRSTRPEPHSNIPPPTSEEEKSKMTRRYFATIIAISYAIFLVMFALILFIGDALVDQSPMPQIFCIFMLTIGFCYFIFLYIDIRLHIRKAKKAVTDREEQMKKYEEQMLSIEENFQSSLELRQTANGNVVQIPIPDIVMNPIKPISHRYCFATGRHGEFLYLKLGAAWFCFGLLIHSTLSIIYGAIYFAQDSECFDALQLTVDIMFPIYSLVLLFFIFKYCNVIINSYRGVARILIMHAIGTSLAFWIYTIVRETVDAILLKRDSKKDENTMFMDLAQNAIPYNLNSTSYAYQTEDDDPCPNELNTVRRMFSPYLYPFVIEFCILIVGIFYMMWANISHCPKKHHGHGHGNGHDSSGHGSHNDLHNSTSKLVPNQSFSNLHTINEEHNRANGHLIHPRPGSVASDNCNNVFDHDSSEYKSSIIVHADCTAASRGLFVGMILLILKIVFIILLHVAARNPDYVDTGVLIDRIFELIVLVMMIFAVIFAYIQTSKLDINLHPMSKLDDVLLFIAIPAFFSETIFSMVPAVVFGSYLNVAIIMSQLIQILIQTPWIIDALRRCSNSDELRKKKPGRELVTFLTIANVALWIYYTFSVKTVDTQDERYYFYTDEIWSILNHLSLPLIMFYRFHASVCLVDIWRHSYEPGEFAH